MYPKRGLGDANVQMGTTPRPHAPHSLVRGRPRRGRDRRVKPETQKSGWSLWRDLIPAFRRWRASARSPRSLKLAYIGGFEKAAHRDVQKDRSADAARTARSPQGLVRAWKSSRTEGSLEHISLVMDRDGGAEGEAVSLMTLHSAKGPRIRKRVLRAGRKGCLRASARSKKRAAPASRRATHRPCRTTEAQSRQIIIATTTRRIKAPVGVDQRSVAFLDELPAHKSKITESRAG